MKAITQEPPTVESYLQRSTVWSFADRGSWAGHDGRYRGNWSPHVPRNLILRYTAPGGLVVDPMCGGGTTIVEARLLNRRALGFDINPKALAAANSKLEAVQPAGNQQIREGDARHLDALVDGSVDLVALHPPYWNIIGYRNGRPGDLSCRSHRQFLDDMQAVAGEAFRVVRTGGHCAVPMGDTRRHGDVVPLSLEVRKIFSDIGFKLREHVIKLQHNTTSERRGWKGAYPFLLLAHENLFVFRKDG